jgi:peptidoglycan hydrolase-like protein with peptidoglycan-binding domain
MRRSLLVAVLLAVFATGAAAPIPAQAAGTTRASARVLRLGMTGSDVRRLQRRLTSAGYRVAVTGRFNQRTRRAVVRFQREHGLTADGVAGPLTVAALALPEPPAQPQPQPQPDTSTPPAADASGWVFPMTPRAMVLGPETWTPDQGIDIPTVGGACGPAVTLVAVDDGTIVREGISGFGDQAPVLRLDRGAYAGRHVYYGHAQPALVPVGAHVVRGQPIAQVGCGKVGISSGPHLEIGISVEGGPTCCPAWGQTSGLITAEMKRLYATAP